MRPREASPPRHPLTALVGECRSFDLGCGAGRSRSPCDRTLFTSAVCIWELATAARKNHPLRRPDLRGRTPRSWFNGAVASLQVQVLPITVEIAAEAADVAPLYGSGDPGDCFLIATARINNLALVTRDLKIIELAASDPAYLSVIPC